MEPLTRVLRRGLGSLFHIGEPEPATQDPASVFDFYQETTDWEDDTPEPAFREIGEEQVVAAADRLVANTVEEANQLIELYDADPDRVDGFRRRCCDIPVACGEGRHRRLRRAFRYSEGTKRS